jgi:hypothetical protein
MIAWWLDLELHLPSVPITTKVVGSNPAHGKVYSIQHYLIQFASDARLVGHHKPTKPTIQQSILLITLFSIHF